jgi:hypothetical protein
VQDLREKCSSLQDALATKKASFNINHNGAATGMTKIEDLSVVHNIAVSAKLSAFKKLDDSDSLDNKYTSNPLHSPLSKNHEASNQNEDFEEYDDEFEDG